MYTRILFSIFYLQAQVPQDQALPFPALGEPELLGVVSEEAGLLVVQQIGEQVLQEQLELLGGGACCQVCGKLRGVEEVGEPQRVPLPLPHHGLKPELLKLGEGAKLRSK